MKQLFSSNSYQDEYENAVNKLLKEDVDPNAKVTVNAYGVYAVLPGQRPALKAIFYNATEAYRLAKLLKNSVVYASGKKDDLAAKYMVNDVRVELENQEAFDAINDAVEGRLNKVEKNVTFSTPQVVSQPVPTSIQPKGSV